MFSKKDAIQWGIMLGIAATLYFTGLHSEVIGQVQSLAVRTGAIKPKLDEGSSPKELPNANYNFSLIDLKGNPVEFTEFKGKTVFLNLWATWCPPCIAEMPGIQNLYEKVKDDRILFVMISLDEGGINKPRRFVERKKYSFPVYQLASEPPEIFSTSSIPTTFVISPGGKVVLRHEGLADYDNEKFIKFLKRW